MPGYKRTLKIYPWFAMLLNCLFWMPVFFLYLSGKCGLGGALQLEAIYYAGIAILEIPSGFFSDRIGRRITLIIASLLLCTAYLLFAVGNTFLTFAAAEIVLAGGFAFASGTDTSLLYETLTITGHQDDYLKQESFVTRMSFIGGAFAAAAGGALALISFPAAYYASFAAALCMLVLAVIMTEPKNCASPPPETAFHRQLFKLCGKSISKNLKFTFIFSISMTILLHIPYEFYQTYLDKLHISLQGKSLSPLISGFHMAATMAAGAYAIKFIPPLIKRFSCRTVLLLLFAGELILIFLMALLVHPIIAILLITRSLPRSITWPIIRALQAPELENHERATFLSLQSLSGRLGYSGVLLLISSLATDIRTDITKPLLAAGCIGLVLLAILLCTKQPHKAIKLPQKQ